MTLGNESTRHTAKQGAIEQLGNVLLKIIAEIEEAPEDNEKYYFRRIYMNYGFCRML